MPSSESATVRTVSGPGVPVRGNDIDTDRILPARFLKEVTFDRMGSYAFYDARRDADGTLNDHPFNRFTEARLLVVEQNFGCGSSREHAPQALMRWGIEGLIGVSFSEIFAGNCLALGLPTATADADTIAWLMDRIEADPSTELTLDVGAETVAVDGRTLDVRLDPTHKEALLRGLWDTTTLMHRSMDAVRRTARRLPYLSDFER